MRKHKHTFKRNPLVVKFIFGAQEGYWNYENMVLQLKPVWTV